ncbi:RodZ family helix-turn-helix domain-containing protein [Limnohabitans sp. DM1]|uniref:helix-turn-helix domain-containing protein n=1 Tax=Limnohabitans sp. DM1 TaxID=1597955 RepID=UPI000A5B66BB|nr:helix-turn-helix transcriptional regulator [Limnohabitans sp. DM1]
MPELMLTSFSKNSSLSRTLARPGHNKNLLQANRDAVILLGQGNDSSSDMKGQVLRQLRLTQNLDPAVLATEACISVAQLYEIEKGVDSLFYSDNLRQQAARRIAQLLGIDWNHIDERCAGLQTATNVVTLQRSTVVRGINANASTTVLSSSSAPNTAILPAPSPIDIAVNSHISLSEAATMPPVKTAPASQTTFALGLSTPSADSQPSDESGFKSTEQTLPEARSGRVLWWLITAIGLSAISFYVAEQEGYVRQYWPEFYHLLRTVQQAM